MSHDRKTMLTGGLNPSKATRLAAVESYPGDFRGIVEDYAEKVQRDYPKYAPVYLRAIGGKSKAGAIKAKCLECSAFNRIEAQNCQVPACPLWKYRPYQPKRSVT